MRLICVGAVMRNSAKHIFIACCAFPQSTVIFTPFYTIIGYVSDVIAGGKQEGFSPSVLLTVVVEICNGRMIPQSSFSSELAP